MYVVRNIERTDGRKHDLEKRAARRETTLAAQLVSATGVIRT
jgi:hypothetical protein